MAITDGRGTVSLQELIISSLAQTEAHTKLMIEKGVITRAEFTEKLSEETAAYNAMFRKRLGSQ